MSGQWTAKLYKHFRRTVDAIEVVLPGLAGEAGEIGTGGIMNNEMIQKRIEVLEKKVKAHRNV